VSQGVCQVQLVTGPTHAQWRKVPGPEGPGSLAQVQVQRLQDRKVLFRGAQRSGSVSRPHRGSAQMDQAPAVHAQVAQGAEQVGEASVSGASNGVSETRPQRAGGGRQGTELAPHSCYMFFLSRHESTLLELLAAGG
jgi:hypothetical protein